ncbi:MAG: L-fucose/L-arabinose isomerase family protein [Anaerolineae bacterium]
MTQSTGMRLGFVPLARSTFDVALANRVIDQVCSRLEGAGFSLTGPQQWISNVADASEVAQRLADDPPDLLLVLQATFADSTMVTTLAQAVDAPLLIWAVPEARTGGRLRLNSLCGINLAAHALKRAGRRYDHLYAAPEDPDALEKVRTLALAGRVRRLLRRARIGRIGEHPSGFDSCKLDRPALKHRFGLKVVQIELDTVFQGAQTVEPREVDAVLQDLSHRLDELELLDRTAMRGTLAAYLTMQRLAEQEELDGLAVRCWPEFFTELGCAACGAMSMLSDELVPCSCEADVNGTITQLILQWLSGTPAFGTDLVSADVDEDVAVLWHCGLAPLSMADPATRPRGTIHSNRHLPLLMEFPLRPGRVTVARLSEANGDYRLIVGEGEMLRAPLSFSGTSGVLRFERPVGEVLDVILDEGLEHHLSVTYGDCVPALLALSEMLELPVLRL